MPNVESRRLQDSLAIRRVTAFTGLILKFSLGHGAGRRRKQHAVNCQRTAGFVLSHAKGSDSLHVNHTSSFERWEQT